MEGFQAAITLNVVYDDDFFRSILSDPLRRNGRVAPLERHCSSVSFNTVQSHQ